MKGETNMSTVDKLISYILSLTPEQEDEIVAHLPKNGERMSKDEYILKIVVLLKKCNDIPLIDLIYKLLYKSA